MVVAVTSIVCTALGAAFVVYLVRVAGQEEHARLEEDAARAHLAEHGHWPGEEPGREL